MIKVCAIVSAFAAFLVFAPGSRAEALAVEEPAAPPLVSVDWALATPFR